MSTERYLEPNQAQRHAPTQYEDLLGDALERAFAAGLHELPAIVRYLNECGPSAENGQDWTEDGLRSLLARLAD